MLRRAWQLILAFAALILLSPILLIAAVLIKLDSHGSIFFWQKRIGQNGKEFWLLKFRTMTINHDNKLITSSQNMDRITRVGKYIRKFHLDEFLQLYNVIKGDMNIIGYRPEVPKYIDYHHNLWQQVLQAKPGITGFGTVKIIEKEYKILSKSSTPEKDYIEQILPEKLNLEIYYLNNQNLAMDINILLQTAIKAIK